MGEKWRKIKIALGLNIFLRAKNNDYHSSPPSERRSGAALLSPPPSNFSSYAPASPSQSLIRSSSEKTCSICLTSMKRGDGQAIFTAECSHSFHFHCIASNVKHGNKICPICRAKWKDIPLQGPRNRSSFQEERNHIINGPPRDETITFIRRIPSRSNMQCPFQVPEPVTYDDDEPLGYKNDSASRIPPTDCTKLSIKTFTEVSGVPRSSQVDSFTVLINLKVPCSNSWHNISNNDLKLSTISRKSRAPVDLVTVLDTSGSMAGTKLALLKRAMGFVIQNLGPFDRLAVISFSSTARRIFPLRRMSDSGRQQALQAVNSLVASGGTNIAEGLRKGAKIMDDRKEKNPIASIILLSDGQDTYTINTNVPNFELLLPISIRADEALGFMIPVHAFGFGADHDASAMHSISEVSGGTFSFIETEGVIQDAFAQCIGGLLSVVVKDLHVKVECVHPEIHIGSLKAGSYRSCIYFGHRSGSIDVGNLMRVRCEYTDPVTEESLNVEGEEVRIRRIDVPVEENISIAVDRQRNRIQAAEGMTQANVVAESGDMASAVSILENIRTVISKSVSAKSQDRLCICLDAELKEMQERMASKNVYKATGRAYILSGLSSHSWQRATTRGDSTDFSSHVQSYQTPSMTEMVTRSQATSLTSSSSQRLLRPVWSFGSKQKPG